jgi:hypothetical protein
VAERRVKNGGMKGVGRPISGREGSVGSEGRGVVDRRVMVGQGKGRAGRSGKVQAGVVKSGRWRRARKSGEHLLRTADVSNSKRAKTVPEQSVEWCYFGLYRITLNVNQTGARALISTNATPLSSMV